MSEIKRELSDKFLKNFKAIFYISKMCGIYPYDFQKFYYQGVLQGSQVGSCIVIVVMSFVFVLFNLMILMLRDEEALATYNHLNLFVNIVFTYISPVMMITDQITAMLNQRKLPELFERIDHVDEGLQHLGIPVNNKRVKLGMWLMIGLTLCFEVYVFTATFVLENERTVWLALLWIFAIVPNLYNTLEKIWFAGILLGLRERFEAINIALESIAEDHERKEAQRNREKQFYNDVVGHQIKMPLDISEISAAKLQRLMNNAFGELLHDYELFKNSSSSANFDSELSNFVIVRERFINLCQLHDSTCQIAKSLNELWAYPLLILMAYGFVMVTSQLYFVYCATQMQHIPLIFRSAKEIPISMIWLLYVAGKCVTLMFFSWKTTLASRRTGICLHKCGVAADTNEIYEIVNHLSLKLLNHIVNFSACGFFTLDMATLYAVCGAITSYLIILIQFNMAGQQVRSSKELAASNETTSISLQRDNVTLNPFKSAK